MSKAKTVNEQKAEHQGGNGSDDKLPSATEFFKFLQKNTQKEAAPHWGVSESTIRAIRRKYGDTQAKPRLVRRKLQLAHTPEEWLAAQQK